MSWSSLVIDRLAQHKRDGLPFDEAWTLALRYYPPAGGVGEVTTLFDERAEPHDPLADFLRRVCEAAYLETVGPAGQGNGPSVKYFRPDMIRDMDSSAPALRSTMGGRTRYRAAA